MESIAPSIAVVVVATVYFAYLIVKMALQHEEKKLAMKGGGERAEQILTETQAEMERLRERVQVLERLATDEDRRVASEISRLGQHEKIGLRE